MTTIVTRAGKGSPLTHTEVDTNFTNLNTNKLETAAIPLGTLAAPSISFVGDANTGAYSPGADTLAFVTAGSNRVHITSGGLVGIGNSSPGSFNSFANNLVVGTGTGTNGITIYAGNTSTSSLNFADGTSGNDLYPGYIVYNHADDSLSFTVNYAGSASARMFISSAGNVGIGTTGPDANSQLHIVGSSYQPLYVNTTSAGGGGAVFFRSGTQALVVGTAGSSWLTGSSTADGLIRSEANLIFATGGNNQRAQIDSSGRLLVGTSSSSYPALLQVSGNTTNASGHGILQLRRGNNATTAGDDLGAIWFGDGLGGNRATIEAMADAAGGTNDLPSRLGFSTTADGASSPTERMRIDNLGRIFTYNANTGNNSLTVSHAAGAGTSVANYVGGYGATAVNTGTSSFVVWTNGDVQNTNNSYTGLSDIKLKENIVDANSQWDDIKALQVRKFNFKEGQTHTQIGLVAQEVGLVSPGLVGESPDRDAEGNDLGTVTKSVNYSVLYMKAVKALQEAMGRIETLEQRLTAAGID